MTCHYCRAQNDADAHRCTKCGRRTLDRTPVQMTAAVPELETVEMPSPAPEPLRPQLVTTPPAKRAEHTAQPSYQANLFGPMEAGRVSESAAQPRKASPRPRRDYSRQQRLDFQETRTLPTSVEASVYCGAPIAMTAHRVMAAAVDTGLALLAVAVFAITLWFAGINIDLTKKTLPYYAAAAALICLLYRALFCVGNSDTPGCRWTGLRIIDFDGRFPTRKQRWYRLLGGCVGFVAGGVGLIWAVVDEERLTWHDHMSKTFPTPRFLQGVGSYDV